MTAALLVSAIMSPPSRSLVVTSIALAVCGTAGIAYGVVVIRRARRQTYYEPAWQDWLWYAVLPYAGYAPLGLGAAVLRTDAPLAFIVTATAALSLLVIVIHNAWDTVIQIVVSPPGALELPHPQPPSGSRSTPFDNTFPCRGGLKVGCSSTRAPSRSALSRHRVRRS